jgi:hypothetical protein
MRNYPILDDLPSSNEAFARCFINLYQSKAPDYLSRPPSICSASSTPLKPSPTFPSTESDSTSLLLLKCRYIWKRNSKKLSSMMIKPHTLIEFADYSLGYYNEDLMSGNLIVVEANGSYRTGSQRHMDNYSRTWLCNLR